MKPRASEAIPYVYHDLEAKHIVFSLVYIRTWNPSTLHTCIKNICKANQVFAMLYICAGRSHQLNNHDHFNVQPCCPNIILYSRIANATQSAYFSSKYHICIERKSSPTQLYPHAWLKLGSKYLQNAFEANRFSWGDKRETIHKQMCGPICVWI